MSVLDILQKKIQLTRKKLWNFVRNEENVRIELAIGDFISSKTFTIRQKFNVGGLFLIKKMHDGRIWIFERSVGEWSMNLDECGQWGRGGGWVKSKKKTWTLFINSTEGEVSKLE